MQATAELTAQAENENASSRSCAAAFSATPVIRRSYFA
jgi:hypothetical protein